MDIIECIDPIKFVLRQFESLLDSYVFEVGQSMANKDMFKTEVVIKRFRNNVNSFIKEMNWKLNQLECDIDMMDVIQQVKEKEDDIVSLKDHIDTIKDRSEVIEKENTFLKRELAHFKIKLNNIELCIGEKDEIIKQIQEDKEAMRISFDKNDKYLISKEKDRTQEVELLKNVIKLKEQETKVIKRDREEIKKKVKKVEGDNLISSLLVKQYETEIGDLKSQIERCKNLEKIDQQNLINTKSLLKDRIDQLKSQEDQLQVDLELITKLKNELSNIQDQIRSVIHENKELSCDLDDERKANLIIYKDMESLQMKMSSLTNTVANSTAKIDDLKRKKKDLKVELENLKFKFTEVQGKNYELQSHLGNLESEVSTVKMKLDDISKLCNNQRKEIKFLQTVKSISDDKIRLLNSFVEDFRSSEHDLQKRLISENNSFRTRIDIMKQAYEKLF